MHDYLSRLHYLENPEIYEVNRLAPHSDHVALQSGGRSLPAIDLCGEWEVGTGNVLFEENVSLKSVRVPESFNTFGSALAAYQGRFRM